MLEEYENEEGGRRGEEESLLNMTDANRWTALHYACQGNHANIVQTLATRQADCNKVSSDGWTPLMLASSEGYIECARALLKHPSI